MGSTRLLYLAHFYMIVQDVILIFMIVIMPMLRLMLKYVASTIGLTPLVRLNENLSLRCRNTLQRKSVMSDADESNWK